MEREMIFRVLTDTGGQQQRTADILGISLRTLSRKLKAYNERGGSRMGMPRFSADLHHGVSPAPLMLLPLPPICERP